MLALEPGLSDLSVLPASATTPLVGVGTHRPVQAASAEFGEKAAQMIVERALVQVRDRLNNKSAYSGHGWRA
jgi:hypothetical protein